MARRKGMTATDLEAHYTNRVRPQTRRSPWVLRLTDHKGRPTPVMVVKERQTLFDEKTHEPARQVLKERGLLYGPAQQRCLPIIRDLVFLVSDEAGINLDLHLFLQGNRIDFRGNLPLDDEAGYRLALLFKLQERIRELDRVELMARRIARFSREEAAYWFSRITDYGPGPNRWAAAGLKILLAGHPHDPEVEHMLERLRLE